MGRFILEQGTIYNEPIEEESLSNSTDDDYYYDLELQKGSDSIYGQKKRFNITIDDFIALGIISFILIAIIKF
jgi:hypothetical protein